MADVFISYSRKDGDFVRELQSALEARELEAWVDWEDIPPTAEWMTEVEQAIDAADALLFVLSPDSARSEVCGRELERATTYGKRIVPIVRRDVQPERVPPAVRERNWIFCRESDDFRAAIDTLCTALATDLDWVSAHTRLLVRAVEWDRQGNDRSFLLRGRDLADAERWLAEAAEHETPQPTPLQQSYLAAGRASATRSTRLRVAALSVALVVAITLAIVALFQRETAQRNATVARSRELAARANEALSTDPELGVLLARESVGISDTSEAQQALRRALDSSYVRTTVRTAHSSATGGAEFGFGGRRIIVGQHDGATTLWDVRHPKRPIAALCCHDGPVLRAAISPDDSRAVTASSDGTARVWDLEDLSADPIVLAGHEGFVSTASFSPDGSRVVTSGADGTVRIWDAHAGGTPLVVLQGHDDVVRDVHFDATGARVVSASFDGTARIWDAERGGDALVTFRPTSSDAPVLASAFSPDGMRVVTGLGDGSTDVWNAADGSLAFELRGHSFSVESVSYSPDGSRIVTAGDDGTARIWDAEQSLPPLLTLSGHKGTVWQVAFSPDGTQVVTGGNDGTARVWDVRGSDLEAVVRSSGAPFGDAQFDRGAGRLVLADDEGLVKVVDLRHRNRATIILRGHTDAASSASFSDDGKRIVSSAYDGTARVWDATGGDPLLTLDAHVGGVTRARFSPDGRRIVTAGDRSAKLWDARSGKQVGTMRAGDAVVVYDAAFSPDGKLVALAGADGKARLFDARATRRPLRTWTVTDGAVHAIAFSPDGQRVVTSGTDGRALVWDARRTGRPILTLSGHIGPVFHASYSRDGRRIVTAGADATVRLWTADTGQPLTVLRSASSSVPNAAVNRDGTIVVATDSVARISRCELCVSTELLLRLAERRSTRELTDAERDLYLHSS